MEQPSKSDIQAVSEKSRRLLAELQRYLEEVEPIAGRLRRSSTHRERYFITQTACDQAHRLWTGLLPLTDA